MRGILLDRSAKYKMHHAQNRHKRVSTLQFTLRQASSNQHAATRHGRTKAIKSIVDVTETRLLCRSGLGGGSFSNARWRNYGSDKIACSTPNDLNADAESNKS